MGLLDILSQVVNAGQAPADHHVDEVLRTAPSDALQGGIADAFRSNQTPDMGDMVSQLFGNSNPQQQAGLLNQIIRTIGPAAAAAMATGALAKVLKPGTTQVTPDQMTQVSPTEVRDVVVQAQKQNPAITDDLAAFYSQHSGLIKTLGGVALMIAMAKMKQSMENRG